MENDIGVLFPDQLWKKIKQRVGLQRITEIRIRINRPIFVHSLEQEYVLKDEMADASLIRQILGVASRFSLYSYESQLKQGFLSLRGGHRIGIGGERNEDLRDSVFRYITFLNIRVAHEVPDCAHKLLSYLEAHPTIRHMLILSPPGCGKTTLLRDLIRLISDGSDEKSGRRVGVSDERMELSACFQGVPQLNLGVRTDVIAGGRKMENVEMLLRSMNPQVLAMDELGEEEEESVMRIAARSGCEVIATRHGSRLSFEKELREKRQTFWDGYFFIKENGIPGRIESGYLTEKSQWIMF